MRILAVSGFALSRRKASLVNLALLLALVFCAGSAGASVVLYTTLGPHGEYETGGGYEVSGVFVIAMSFSPNATVNLQDAVLALGNFSGNNSPVNLYLESDATGVPGTVLDNLTQVGTIPPSPGGLVTFDCTVCPMVQIGTRYWIVALETNPNSVQSWMFAYQDATGIFAYNDGGSFNGPWTQSPGTLSGFRIDGGTGTGTPEPDTIIMLSTGVLAIAGAIRRKFAA